MLRGRNCSAHKTKTSYSRLQFTKMVLLPATTRKRTLEVDTDVVILAIANVHKTEFG